MYGSWDYCENQDAIKQLSERIEYCNNQYRIGEQVISDAEYDTLVGSLKEMCPDHEWFKHPEPIPVSETRKVKLPVPMRSLDKVKTIDELKAWAWRIGIDMSTEVCLMPKFDGISLLVDEWNSSAYTRGGNDNEGMKSDEHLIKMGHQKDVRLHYTGGEAIIPKMKWKHFFEGKINESTGQPYKSARNTVSGLFRRDNATDDLLHVDYIRYATFPDKCSMRFTQLLDYMSEIYHQPAYYTTCLLGELTHDMLRKWFDKWGDDYWIDGVVVYVNDTTKWERIGRHLSTGNPQWAIAYKGNFEEVVKTTVKNVNCRVSKNGYLRPTVEIEPVFLNGAQIENPTGNNAKFIFDNNIASGSVIKIKRSGEVIPKIVGVTSYNQSRVEDLADRLSICPACGSPTKWNNSLTDIVCTNSTCRGRMLAKIIYFFMTVGYDNVGEEIIEKLFEAGHDSVRKILDLKVSEICAIDGLGDSIADLMVNKHNRRIKSTLFNLPVIMHASDCFEGIGQKKASQLINKLSERDIELLVSGQLRCENCSLMDEKYKSSKTFESFLDGVRPFHEFLSSTNLSCSYKQDENVIVGNKCAGMSVCFSGVRDNELEKMIIAQGGHIVSGVSKNTTHLIVADLRCKTSKLQKAQELGINIVLLDTAKKWVE